MVQYQSLSSLHFGRRTNCMPVHTYTNWNKRQSDTEKQLKPYRKYFFIYVKVQIQKLSNFKI